MNFDITFLTALSSLVASLAALYNGWHQRKRLEAEVKKLRAEERKTTADASDAISDAAVGLIAPLRAQVTELEAWKVQAQKEMGEMQRKLRQAEEINEEYRVGIDRLIHQIKSYRKEPVWWPGKPKTGPLLGENGE